MEKREKEMFTETLECLKQLDWEGLIMANASAKTLLAVQQANGKNAHNNVPAA